MGPLARASRPSADEYKGSIFKDLRSLDKILSIPAHLPRTEFYSDTRDYHLGG